MQGLLIEEMNTEKLTTGGNPQAPSLHLMPQSLQNFIMKIVRREVLTCVKNIAADNSKLVVPTIKASKVKDYSITEQKVKEPVFEGAKSAAEDTKGIKSIS